MNICVKAYRSILNASKAIGLLSIMLTAFINKSNAQSLPPHSEKTIIRDINSLLASIQIENSSRPPAANQTVANYGKSIMKNVKGFKMLYDQSLPDHIIYSKDIKQKGKRVTTYISFQSNISYPTQVYVRHSLFYLPEIDVENIYSKVLNTNFGNRIGTLCEGDNVYSDSLTQSYVLLRKDQISNAPYILIYPKEFTSGSIWDNKETPFKEKIINDSFPILNDFTKIRDDLKANDNFILEYSSDDENLFSLNFFHLIKKEYDEYLENNLDELQSNPDVKRFYSMIDSLKASKMKELNIQRLTIGIHKTGQLVNNRTKQISLSVMLYHKPDNRQQEIDLISNKLNYTLVKAKLNDLSIPLERIFKVIKEDTLLNSSYEIVTGNYLIRANKLDPINRSHWLFTISLKACE